MEENTAPGGGLWRQTVGTADAPDKAWKCELGYQIL